MTLSHELLKDVISEEQALGMVEGCYLDIKSKSKEKELKSIELKIRRSEIMAKLKEEGTRASVGPYLILTSPITIQLESK
jgi:hypothetical protein